MSAKKQSQSPAFGRKHEILNPKSENCRSEENNAKQSQFRAKEKLIPGKLIDIIYYRTGRSGMFGVENEQILRFFNGNEAFMNRAVRLC